MSDYSVEEQTLASIKTWFADNARAILWALIVGLSLYLAYSYWGNHNKAQQTKAYELANLILMSHLQNDEISMQAHLQTIQEKYSNFEYASLSSLLYAANTNNKTNAKDALEWAVANSKDNAIQDLARLNLAIVLAETEDYAAALASVADITTESYASAAAEVKGDILLRSGKGDAALISYQDSAGKGVGYSGMLTVKMDDLA